MKIDKLLRYALGLGLAGSLIMACSGVLTPDNPGAGGVDAAVDAPVGGATAKDFFVTNVYPLATAQCGCHGSVGPTFLGADADATYTYLKDGYPDTLLYTDTAGSSFYTTAYPNAHQGTQWDATAADYISQWIALEYEEYQGGGDTARDLFDQNVNAAIEAKCGCHNAAAPVFRGNTPDETYGYLTANYPSTLLGNDNTSRIYAVAYPNAHQSQTWSDTEAGYISDWIAQEYAERQ